MTIKENNIFPVWKPQMMSSGDVVKKIKSKFNFKKVGHCGTLDPFAEGLLIVVTGSETLNSNRYMESVKTYHTIIKLGVETDSLDSTGSIIKKGKIDTGNYSEKYIKNILSSFIGNIKQRPPSFSAKKINGIRLYKLARKDIFIKLKPVDICVESIKFISIKNDELTLEITCQKGTYIRQLGYDIAVSMGTIGHLKSLTRIKIGDYCLENSIYLKDIENWKCITQ